MQSGSALKYSLLPAARRILGDEKPGTGGFQSMMDKETSVDVIVIDDDMLDCGANSLVVLLHDTERMAR